MKLLRIFAASSALVTVMAAAAPPPAVPIVTVPPAPPVAKSPDQMTPQELAAWKKRNGSLYVQCDGQPDNMTDGETAARVLGAIALIGLLAPAPEAADPGKRKFGAEGVAACSALIEGVKRESDASRRIGLILARGSHRIEAKDYQGALADAALARSDAAQSGLAADPYWQRSRGRGADVLESAALFRLGRAEEAGTLAIRSHSENRYAALALLGMPAYYETMPALAPGELGYHDAARHAFPLLAATNADRLEQVGRFGEAATLRDALLDYNRAAFPKAYASRLMAEAAISHALAGDTDRAAQLAREAQENFDRRKAAGNPDTSPGDVIEQLDLYNIIRMAGAGDVKTARRLYAARSQWLAPSFGASVEVNRRLRAGAAKDELIGGLERDPAALWKARAEDAKARAVAGDADNKSLFAYPIAIKASAYEGVAKNAWKVEKSPWLLKPKKEDPNPTGYDLLFNYGASPSVMAQAYTLHAALLAKSRGHRGFVIQPIITQQLLAARIKTGNEGDPGLPAPLFNDADTVIAALSPLIPDPAALKARQATRSAQARQASR